MKRIRIAQINLQHKSAANNILMDNIHFTKVDIVLITKPYISKRTNVIPGVALEYAQYHVGYGSLSAILIRKSIAHF